MAGGRRSVSVCAESGCPALTSEARCPDHQQPTDYGQDHRRLRARWDIRIQQGEYPPCARCGIPIGPGEPWHLDHTEDRTGYLGPAHDDCNSGAHA